MSVAVAALRLRSGLPEGYPSPGRAMRLHIRRLFSKLVPRRRRHWVLIAIPVVLVAAWFLVPQLFVPMIRGKLQGMIEGHLDAKLEIGRLMYAPPFGVRARNVRLVSAGGGDNAGTELLKVRKLDLKLARSPFRDGPLVIQNITVHDPEAHLIRTADGRLVGMHSVVKEDSATAQATRLATQPAATQPGNELDIDTPEKAKQEAAGAKLSDMFELRHFGIKGGRIVYQDQSRPDMPPVVWKDLDVGMQTTPQSKAVYGFKLDASHGGLARLGSSGSFDLDELRLDLGSLRLEARTTYSENESPLPAQIQRVLRDYQVAGRVTLDANGRFNLRDLRSGTFAATVALEDASGYAPGWDATLDRLAVKLSINNRAGGTPDDPRRGPVRIRVDSFEAASGDSTARLDKAELVLDRDANTWGVAGVSGRVELGRETASLPKKSRPVLAKTDARGEVHFTAAARGRLRPGSDEYVLIPEDLELLVYPRGVSLLPPKTPAPIGDLGGGGSIRKDRGTRVVVAQDLTFDYGGDSVVLASARLPLPHRLADLRDRVRIEEISGTIDFRRPGPRYPGKFGKVIDSLRPVGSFDVGRDSWFAVTKVEPDLRARTDPAAPPRTPPRRKGDWFFSVATDAGSFTLTDERIPLTNMTGDATVSNLLIDVRRIEADVLGGRLSGTVKVTPGSNMKYQGRAYLRDIDLEAVSKVYILPESKDAKLTGEGNLNIQFAGTKPRGEGSAFDTLQARGEFEVLRGHFWTLPLLGEVARRAGGGRELTVGEAAGVFEVADRRIHLHSAAVSSPALGVQGSGSIGLDKRLDLNLVAAPLGDWRDRLKQTRVPVVSDVAGEVAGALQTLVNGATRGLLYEFRITGTTKSPDVAAVPVPALTDTAAALFSSMLRDDQEGRLLESVRERGEARGAPTRDERGANPGSARPRAHAGS